MAQAMVSYLKASPNEKTYPDYLQAVREAKKEEVKELSCGQTAKEFIVHHARAVKDAQQEEKCCYHCSSPEHFTWDCPW